MSEKPDSYDICFVADGDTAGFLRERLGSTPGPVVDPEGTVLGEHDGAFTYTVGQRKGLHLGRPAPDGRPRYVLEVQPVTNTVVVGPVDLLDVHTVTGTGAVWFDTPPQDCLDCSVQVRAHGAPVPGQVRTTPAVEDGTRGGLELRLGSPLRGVAAGQSAVVYLGDRVLGQATITGSGR